MTPLGLKTSQTLRIVQGLGWEVSYSALDRHSTTPDRTHSWTFQEHGETSRSSVPNWPNFRPHNSKGAGKKYVRPSKLAADFLSNIFQKGPKKGRKHFLSSFF